MPLRTRLAFAFILVCLASTASAQIFVFDLSGAQEVPPVPSTASGGCMGQLNQPAFEFTLTCVHNVIGATVMHIHQAPAGSNGSIVFDMGDPASPVTATWSGMTPANITDLLNGNFYLNIHTSGRPAGEIRGQILSRTVDNVSFTANGSQFVPPNSTTATASCTADLDGPATSLLVQCTHDVPSPISAHIHEAPAGVNGPIVFTFPSPASPLSANVPMTPQLVADFAATFLYLDIHTASGSEETPSPQIRGQIGTPPAPITTGTIRIVKQTNPAGGTNFGFTQNITGGNFNLNDAQTQTFNAVTPGTYTVTENDPSVSPGGYTLADVSCDDADSSGNTSTRTATIALAAGEVITCTFRNFQTAATDQLFVFHLSGDQEVPPIATNDRGGCMGRFDAGASQLDIVCTHNVTDPTVMHIHVGAPGVNGPPVFDLGSPISPVIATWAGMTPADVANLLGGNLYVNIHTAGRPAGEIRGQILPRTVDTVNFPADSSQVVPPGTSPTTANCTADLDTLATSLAVTCTHNMASPDLAHIHDAPFGVNGPVIFTFPSAASPINGNAPLTPRFVADFAAGFLYFDLHGVGVSEEDQPDEIRGQIGPLPSAATTGTIQIVKSTSPSGGTGFTFTDNVPGSSGTFMLNDGGTQTFTNVPVGTYTITENLPSGYSLTDVSCGDNDSTGNPFARTATVSLQGGETVICTFRNLRTFTAPTTFLFHLSGSQEAPPVPSTARGGCFAQFDAASSSLSMICTHNVTDPAVTHIHRGAPGVNGPIVFDLGDPTSPIEAVWTGMTPQDIADLTSGNLYVNIHSGGRPNGEIRGQILPRTVDNFAFPASGSQEVPPTGSQAQGACSADLSNDAASLFVQCQHNVVGVISNHLHVAPPGVDGPVVFNFPLTNPFQGNIGMTPRLLADFAAGFLYVNIHSTGFDAGEIRGQLIAGTVPAIGGIASAPTLSEWAAILFALMLVGVAWWRLRV